MAPRAPCACPKSTGRSYMAVSDMSESILSSVPVSASTLAMRVLKRSGAIAVNGTPKLSE